MKRRRRSILGPGVSHALLRRLAVPADFLEHEGGDEKILADALRLAPSDAIEFFKAKGFEITWDWSEMDSRAHAKAFTIAKAMKLDILRDIRSEVQAAADNGTTLDTFREALTPRLKALGWWGRVRAGDVPGGPPPGVDPDQMVQLGSPHRLATIYRTNLQVAYMVGRYRGQVASAKLRPYLQYIAVMDGVTRPDHAAMNGRIYRIDDPVWQRWTPPNGYNCRCRTRSMSAREMTRDGLATSEGIPSDKDGKPLEPDEGWDTNAAADGLRELMKATQEKQADLEAGLGQKVPTAPGEAAKQQQAQRFASEEARQADASRIKTTLEAIAGVAQGRGHGRQPAPAGDTTHRQREPLPSGAGLRYRGRGEQRVAEASAKMLADAFGPAALGVPVNTARASAEAARLLQDFIAATMAGDEPSPDALAAVGRLSGRQRQALMAQIDALRLARVSMGGA